MSKKCISKISILLAILFVILAIYYWVTPAGSLFSFIPGFEAGSTTIHFKHGLASLILALGLSAYAWFSSAKK